MNSSENCQNIRIDTKRGVTNKLIEIKRFFGIFLGLLALLSALKTTISTIYKWKQWSPPSHMNERYRKSPIFVQYFFNLFQTKFGFILLTNLPKRKINREILLPKTRFLLKNYMSLSPITPVFFIVKLFLFCIFSYQQHILISVKKLNFFRSNNVKRFLMKSACLDGDKTDNDQYW